MIELTVTRRILCEDATVASGRVSCRCYGTCYYDPGVARRVYPCPKDGHLDRIVESGTANARKVEG